MKLGNAIIKINKKDALSFKVVVTFADRKKETIDLSFIFENPKKSKLIKNILAGQMFNKAFIENGALAWPNGYELCPDALKLWANEQKRRLSAEI
jgi:hypothetical protein